MEMQYVDNILQNLELSNEDLKRVSDTLLTELKRGLSVSTHKTSNIKMFPTYVRDIPDGTEEGTYLALDLGGSKFRVLNIHLKGRHCNMNSEKYDIPQSIMEGPGEDLFGHIAECLEEHIKKMENKQPHLHLGFTFSFPCEQRSLTQAILTRWTKGFTCSGVVGKDVTLMLREAIERRKSSEIDIHVIAIINDTTGTLMSCAHRDRDCRIGLIVGTGCNACYIERLEEVETWTGDREPPDQVIINTEWGAFGDNGCLEFLRTSFDRKLDENSNNPEKQLFEKMISGMYLGEIVRIIASKLSCNNIIFKGILSQQFETPFTFKTKYISKIESDSPGSILKTKAVLEKMGVLNPAIEDCQTMQKVCKIVSTRSAHLVAAAVSTLLNKMQRKDRTVVGVDGSVYRYHPHFKSMMEEKISEMTEHPFELMLSEDGSGRGAALVAAVAARVEAAQSK
ncbi:hypothetical protein JTE90_005825 [Oedothorax gibbosus]|uniref:Phosphotransferase n=1 Tax=Oedothorax gibbosus TaxID=931172 RepID=A0AAV6V2W9_9ARAC|nr:hypothetical protein JTE90_005825 [Oedothorax gibbosus]